MKIEERTLTLRNGTEGPRHDPYSYEEWILIENSKKTLLHTGLANFVVDQEGKRWEFFGETYQEEAEGKWKELTGLSLSRTMKIYWRLNTPPTKCKECGKFLQEADGYVGESVYYCPDHGVAWVEAVTDSMIQ